jgi:N-acetylmuramoyl-L-alanine amidase
MLSVIALAMLAAACASPRASSRAPRVSTASREPVREARALLDRMHRGELPGSLERMVADLDDVARREGASTRGLQARRLGADLLAAQWRLTRDPHDRVRASDALESVADERGDEGCSARLALGDLLASCGETERARAEYLRYERECPNAADLAHVHATLALLDPALARAESAAARARVQNVASGFEAARAQGAAPYRRIVIDPGHGGTDPGARAANGLAESTVTLDVSRRLAERLSAMTGADVILTRDRDVFVPLEERAVRANRAGGDLFLSIHCNSSENPLSHGISTYVLDASDDRVAARVARRENGELESDPLADPEVFRILANLRLIGSSSRSTALAQRIQSSLVERVRARYVDTADLGVHTARFHVLVGARMPAVLVELSFLSNPIEAERLGDARYRDDLARAIADAVVAR